MNIKLETINMYREQVDQLIDKKKFKEALEISSRYPLSLNYHKKYVICKTRLLDEYKINERDLESLNCVVKKNPHYSSQVMYLYLEDEVQIKFNKRKKQ